MLGATQSSWGSVRDGKWHITVNATPSWACRERSLCGVEFTPVNVTHAEMPPTNEHHICRQCIRANSRRLSRLRHVRCYDNGGKTADRYTAVYMDVDEGRGLYGARGMSEHPSHPQGVGMYCTAMPGRHLGKRIAFDQLPPDCQRLVLADRSES